MRGIKMRKWPRPVRLAVGIAVLLPCVFGIMILEVMMGPFAEIFILPPGIFFMYLNPELF